MINKTALIVALACLFAFGLKTPSRAGEPETVRFGVCLSLTGEFQDYGNIDLAGIKLFVEDFNSRSDEHGVRLEMLVRDIESSPAKAAACFEELAVKEGIQVVIGGSVSTTLHGMVEMARKHRVVLISSGSTSPDVGKRDDWVFRALFSDGQQGLALAKYVTGELGLKSAAAIINEHYEYGDSFYRAFKAGFEAAGGEIVAEEHYAWNLDEFNVPDLTGILMITKEIGPDMVLLPGYAEDAAALVHQSLAVNYDPIFCGGDAWIHQKLMLAAGNNLGDSYYTGVGDIYADTPEARRFVRLYDMSNDPHTEPASVNGYDACAIMAEALKNGRSAEAIRAGLFKLDNFPLVGGAATIDGETGTRRTVYIHKIVRQGDDFITRIVAQEGP